MDKLQRKIAPVSPINRQSPFSNLNTEVEFVNVILGFCRRVNEICAFLGFYAT